MSKFKGLRDDLYLLGSSCGAIKIGRAENVDRRVRNIAATCPPSIDLRLLDVVVGAGVREGVVHLALAHYRRHGEWFEGAALAEIAAAGGLREFVAALEHLTAVTAKAMSRPGMDRRRSDGPRWTAHRAARLHDLGVQMSAAVLADEAARARALALRVQRLAAPRIVTAEAA